MSDNAKKRKFSFNVFDVFVILIVLILIASVGYKIYSGTAEDKNRKDGEYILSFECDSEYDSMVGYISEGDAVYLRANGELLGYIYKDAKDEGSDVIIVETPSEALPEAPSEAGSEALIDDMQNEEKPTFYTPVSFSGRLQLNGNTEKSNDGDYYTIDGFNITVGSEIEVYTEKAEFTIKVKQLSNISKK